MSEIKGYVVRYTCGRGTFYVTAPPWLGDYTIAPDREAEGAEFTTLAEATAASRYPRRPHAVTIFAVHDDGTEELLPTYEEALAERNAHSAAMRMAKVDLIAMRDAAMVQVAERDAEIERLRAEHDAERKAWARLVGATAEERDAIACTNADRGRGARSSAELERARLEATKQALRALGIDVDALLAEAAS